MRYSLWLAMCLTATTALTGCGDPAAESKAGKTAAVSGKQEVTLRLAHATEDAGDLDGAEKLYRQVIAHSADEPGPRIELAEFYRRHHQEQKAADSLKTALALQSGNADIARELANTYISAGQPEEALPILDNAIATNSRMPLLYNSKGVALDQMGHYHDAQEAYKKAFNLDPTDAITYKVNISMSYILAGSYDKAIALLRPMLDMPEAPAIVRQNLALAYGLKGDSESALKLGLQDLSNGEAQENIRFYRMLAHKHANAPETKTGAATVPASVVKELFPEEDEPAEPAPAPTALNSTARGIPANIDVPVQSAPVSHVEVQDTEMPAKPAPKTLPPSAPIENSEDGYNESITAATPGEKSLPEPILKPGSVLNPTLLLP